MALKVWESKEFQISKKEHMQKNVCDAFEEWVVEGEVEYTFTLEKPLTIGLEVQQRRDKFDNLEWQWCALKAHTKVIEYGKRGFLVHPKPFFSLGVGLDFNDPSDEWSILSMIITPCAFYGRKFPLVWDYQLASCMHMYHFLCAMTHFSISIKCLVKDCNIQEMHLD